ncbi:MAG: hypothetical protein ABIP29_02100 [Candidatus Eisenbacteria bacterium]
MRILSTLRRLAALPPSPWPVLSVYLNTRPVGPQMTTYRPFLKKRLAEELKALKARSPEHESLAVDFARAQHYLDYDLRDETQGVAIFASYAGEDLFDAIQLPVELPDPQVVVGAMPVLFPLLSMADRYRRAAVAVADGGSTRLFVLALGAIEIRREVRDAAARDQDGPATVEALAEHSARALEELARDQGASWILVGGEPGAAAALRRALSPEASGLLIEAGEWDPRLLEGELAEDVTRRIDERERETRLERTRELVASATAGAAVLGVDATLEALRQDRVRELLLSATFPALVPAWTCRACRAFGAGTPPGACPVCGRETAEFVALREELGARAQARGAPVTFVPAGAVASFDDGGGVGAFLR